MAGGATSSSDLRRTITDDPRNAETELAALRRDVVPTEAFYIRSNFSAPELAPEEWRLTVSAPGGPPSSFTLQELQSLGPAETRLVTLECAGNGRTLLDPPVEGTGWTLGGTSTGHFTGLPLHLLLARVATGDALDRTVEVLFRAADRGTQDGWGEIPFERSLPLDAAAARSHPPLLAWALNGEPLPLHHGAPLRLVVPGWYAVASVKWLREIHLLDEPFQGYFQTDRYRYLVPGEAPEPVRRMRVRSLITDPAPEPGADETVLELPPGPATISGVAWSGHGEVAGVRISTDGGERWMEARLEPAPTPYTPARWSVEWDAGPGEHELVSRARDTEGNEQPLTQWWNTLGYGNNEVHRIRVRVRTG